TDWYSFDLDEPAVVNVAMLQAPGSQLRMRVRILDEGGTTQHGGGGASAAGETFVATTTNGKTLEPGKYTFTVEAATRANVQDDNSPPLDEAWSTPYQVQLTKAE